MSMCVFVYLFVLFVWPTSLKSFMCLYFLLVLIFFQSSSFTYMRSLPLYWCPFFFLSFYSGSQTAQMLFVYRLFPSVLVVVNYLEVNVSFEPNLFSCLLSSLGVLSWSCRFSLSLSLSCAIPISATFGCVTSIKYLFVFVCFVWVENNVKDNDAH